MKSNSNFCIYMPVIFHFPESKMVKISQELFSAYPFFSTFFIGKVKKFENETQKIYREFLVGMVIEYYINSNATSEMV